MPRPSHTYAAARLIILGNLGFNAAVLLIYAAASLVFLGKMGLNAAALLSHAAARPYTAKSVGLWNPQCRGIIWLCRGP